MGSIVFIDFLNKLPPNNAVAVAGMLNQLYETSEDDIGFIEDFILHGSPIPNNIVKNINQAFKEAGFSQFTWENCRTDTRNKCFDNWFDEV